MTAAQNDDPDAALARCLRLPRSEQARALEDVCSAFPAQESDLRTRFGILQALGLAQLCDEESTGDFAPGPRSFGDFELLEVLGVGGMGIVHRARQVSLNREVVIKLIRPEQLHFESTRERFRREAEAVARLSHPGIVPIHLVGEHEGVPYFVMESIHGCSLEECIEGLQNHAPERLQGSDLTPGYAGTWPAACTEVIRQVALALDHAHSQGILHRDIKPSNILLSPEGRAYLVDFGLHVIADQEDPAGRITRHGSAPGTLLYMPPEQLESGAYDKRGEVYALAATLYELLTLQPPFYGENRTQTEERIRRGGADPILPRNRTVPRDLEAVVLRALSPEPGRRYANMAAFAADLTHALEGRPVFARPDSVLYRMRRWATRQPVLASVSAIALLLATVLPTRIFLEQRRHNREISAALEEERQAHAESEDLSTILLELFDKADPSRGEPSPAVQAVLAQGVQTIEERLVDKPARRAILKSLLGRVYGNLGLWEQGLQLLQESIQGLEVCVGDESMRGGITLAQLQSDLVEAHTRYAVLIATRGRAGETFALPHRQEAVRLLSELWGPDHWRTLVAAAEYTRLAGAIPAGTVEGHVPPPAEEVLAALRKAKASLEVAAEADALFQAGLLGRLGAELLAYQMAKPTAERASALTEAVEVLLQCRALLEEGGAKDTLDWAKSTNSLALAYKQMGNLQAAEPLYLEVAATYAARMGENSAEHGTVLANTSQLLFQSGRTEDAIAMLERAHGILLRALGPDHPTLVTIEGNLLGTRTRLSKLDGLADRYSALIPRQAKVFGSPHPFLAMSHFGRGTARAHDGDMAGAKQDLEKAVEILNALGEGDKAFAKQIRTQLKALR